VTAAVALSIATVGAGLPWSTPASVRADAECMFDDVDQDLVPHCIELLANTNPSDPDSDGDCIDDFEEILTFTSHDTQLRAKPIDHEMRVLVTSAADACGNGSVYLHLLVRFVNQKLSDVSHLDLYAHVGGCEVPLFKLLGAGDLRVQHRYRDRDGASYIFSMRVSSEIELRRIVPCTLCVRAVVGERFIHTGTHLTDAGSEIGALIPYSRDTLVVQPVRFGAYTHDENEPYYEGAGRVCEMSLSQIGNTSSGVLCEVDAADCKPAAGLRCTTGCKKRVGGTVVLPSGLGTITGG
jgi:hypothetical protein